MRGLLLTGLLLLTCACAPMAPPSVTNTGASGDGGWQFVDPAAAGIDAAGLEALERRLESGEFPNIHAVVVERQGRLVFEKYLAGDDEIWARFGETFYRVFDIDSLHDVRSISKSVTSLLLGIALGDDFEAELERPVIEYFPELRDSVPPGVDRITLRHMLTMTGGQVWNEMHVPYESGLNDESRLYYSGDPIAYALQKAPRDEPGMAWYYNGGSTMVLAGIVEVVSGRKFLDFAHEALFEPLGIDRDRVEWHGQGIFWKRDLKMPAAASGLRLRARDLARIGSLMLHEGNWRGHQVVPREWVRQSITRQTEQTYARWSFDGVYGYGYQWWHGRFTGDWGDFTAVAGVGLGGQRIFILPERRMTVTVFAGNYKTGKWRVSERLLAAIVPLAPPD